MAKRPATVKQADVTRYLKAAIAAGIEVGEVKVAPDGTVSILPASSAATRSDNPCDRLLDP